MKKLLYDLLNRVSDGDEAALQQLAKERKGLAKADAEEFGGYMESVIMAWMAHGKDEEVLLKALR